MALKIGKSQLGNWKQKALKARARLQQAGKKADSVVTRVVHTAEVGTAAFTSGVIQGRTGGVEIVGVPLDLGLASGLHLLGFMGVGGKMSGHLHGFADGFLGSFLTQVGVGVGRTMAEKSGSGPAKLPAATAGALGPASGGARLTNLDRRLATMAASI